MTTETTDQPYAAFIGIDRADQKIDTHIIDAAGTSHGHRTVSIKPAKLQEWTLSVAAKFPGERLAVCIEQPCANVISFLSQYAFIDLYPVNPVTLKRWRETFIISSANDDVVDSLKLAELVRERTAQLKLWAADDPETRKLRSLTEQRRKLIDDRTHLTNRLTAHLKDYFPLALEITGKSLHAKLACNFLRKWPTLGKLQAARETTIREFYHQQASRRQDVIDGRIKALAAAIPLTEDPAILETAPFTTNAILAQLDALRVHIKKFDDEIEATFAVHPDAEIYASLPGAGPNFGARLAAVFGTNRDRYSDATGVQSYIGVAPVTKQSGKRKRVMRRHACAKFHRQTLTEWAGQTLRKSKWARAYYEQQRENGSRRFTALRALAHKWVRIIFRCWKNRETYDEAKYLERLEATGSPLIHRIKAQEKAA